MGHDRLEGSAGADPADIVMDPAERSAIAHATAQLLISRSAGEEDAERVERLVSFAEEHGLDTLAELWSTAHPVSLPGALWRLYLVKAALSHNLTDGSEVFSRGLEGLGGIDAVVVGAPSPLTPEAFLVILDDILRGAFRGEFALALERASAVAKAVSAGVISLPPESEINDYQLSRQALRWSIISVELALSAKKAAEGLLL